MAQTAVKCAPDVLNPVISSDSALKAKEMIESYTRSKELRKVLRKIEGNSEKFRDGARIQRRMVEESSKRFLKEIVGNLDNKAPELIDYFVGEKVLSESYARCFLTKLSTKKKYVSQRNFFEKYGLLVKGTEEYEFDRMFDATKKLDHKLNLIDELTGNKQKKYFFRTFNEAIRKDNFDKIYDVFTYGVKNKINFKKGELKTLQRRFAHKFEKNVKSFSGDTDRILEYNEKELLSDKESGRILYSLLNKESPQGSFFLKIHHLQTYLENDRNKIKRRYKDRQEREFRLVSLLYEGIEDTKQKQRFLNYISETRNFMASAKFLGIYR